MPPPYEARDNFRRSPPSFDDFSPSIFIFRRVFLFLCVVWCVFVVFVQFVIVAAFDHTDPALPVEERVALGLKRCGVSITCEFNHLLASTRVWLSKLRLREKHVVTLLRLDGSNSQFMHVL